MNLKQELDTIISNAISVTAGVEDCQALIN
jgi:hypothetical protein